MDKIGMKLLISSCSQQSTTSEGETWKSNPITLLCTIFDSKGTLSIYFSSKNGDIGLNTLMTPRYLNLFLDVRLATLHLSPQILTPTLPYLTCGLMRKNVKIWLSMF